MSPIVLAALAARVVAGDPSAPILVAIVAAAGLVALLMPPASLHPITRITPVILTPLVLACALVLAANLTVLGDLARVVGFSPGAGLAVGALIALAVIGWTAGDRWWRLATPLGCLFVALPLTPVVFSAGLPWTTWGAVASRPVLTFAAGSPWVTQGQPLGERAAVTFHEPQRVIAASPGTWRVVERDATHVAVREWQLGRGDALTLRPGDELLVDPGARVRFEAGRRVPGAPWSGIAWADGARRSSPSTLLLSAGAIVTLVGGGLALTPAVPLAGVTAIMAPAVLLTFVVTAALWGLYGMAVAPELSLVPRALSPVVEALTRATTPLSRPALLGLVTMGVVALFVGVMLAWRARVLLVLTEAAAATGRPALSATARMAGVAIVVALATALALYGVDAWRLFVIGLGLAAAAVVAPQLAGAGPRGHAAGAVVGTLTFGAVLFGNGSWLPATAGPFAEYPAAAAAPLAWVAARLARARA